MSASCSKTGLLLRISILALFAVAIVLLPATLRADTVTYILSPTDTLADGSSITGSFTVNFVTQTVNGTIVADGLTFTCSNCGLISPGGITSQEGFVALGPGGDTVTLSWAKVPADANPTFFNTDSNCTGCLGTGKVDYLSAGDFANTPEPATWLLLISGLAVLPFIRRRAKA
jgi:hypothetical protein